MAYYLDNFIEPESYYEEPESYYAEPEEFISLGGVAKGLVKGVSKSSTKLVKTAVKPENLKKIGKVAAVGGAAGLTYAAAQSGKLGAGAQKVATKVGDTAKKTGATVGKGLVTAAAVTPIGYVAAKSGVLGETGKEAAKKAEKVYGTVGGAVIKGATGAANVAGKGLNKVSKGFLGFDLSNIFSTIGTYFIMFVILVVFVYVGLPLYGFIGAGGYYAYNTYMKPKTSTYYDNTEEFISLY